MRHVLSSNCQQYTLRYDAVLSPIHCLYSVAVYIRSLHRRILSMPVSRRQQPSSSSTSAYMKQGLLALHGSLLSGSLNGCNYKFHGLPEGFYKCTKCSVKGRFAGCRAYQQNKYVQTSANIHMYVCMPICLCIMYIYIYTHIYIYIYTYIHTYIHKHVYIYIYIYICYIYIYMIMYILSISIARERDIERER